MQSGKRAKKEKVKEKDKSEKEKYIVWQEGNKSENRAEKC